MRPMLRTLRTARVRGRARESHSLAGRSDGPGYSAIGAEGAGFADGIPVDGSGDGDGDGDWGDAMAGAFAADKGGGEWWRAEVSACAALMLAGVVFMGLSTTANVAAILRFMEPASS